MIVTFVVVAAVATGFVFIEWSRYKAIQNVRTGNEERYIKKLSKKARAAKAEKLSAFEAARRILTMDQRPRSREDSWLYVAWWRIAYHGPYQLNWWLKKRYFGTAEGVHDRQLLAAMFGGRMQEGTERRKPE